MSARASIYLDHNATSPMRDEVLEEVARVSREAFGNPGSRHAAGRVARQALEASREKLALLLGAQAREVVFTSGGTESINLAVSGLAGRRGGWIFAPAGEHPATEESLRRLCSSQSGQPMFRRGELPLDALGRLRCEDFDQIPWSEVRLVTVLLAHNETGVLQDVALLSERCRRERTPLHLDAVQAVGKVPVDFAKLGATALSLGAHKFYGPRGIGALLLKSGTRLTPQLIGGHQEQGLRAGTEPVALAAGMALALELWHREQVEVTARLTRLRDRLQVGLVAACAPTLVIGEGAFRLPNTLNIAFSQCDGEALLVALDLAGVCCSMGGTCASGATTTSPILAAMGVPTELHRSCLRLSVGRGTTEEEIDEAIARIRRVVDRQRATR